MTKETLEKIESSMTESEIMGHAAHMCPVMSNEKDGGRLWWIEPRMIHGESCTFDSKFIRECTEPLTLLKEKVTYHKFGGYYGFIRPSMDEAIYQCPKDILDSVVAVEFVIPENPTLYGIYDDALGRHRLKVRYYGGCTLPEDLKRDLVWDD